MTKFVLKHNSILLRLKQSMFFVLLIQVLLFAITIFGGGIMNKLSQNSFDTLNERVMGRKNYLQNEMTYHWGNLTGLESYIKAEIALSGFREDGSLTPDSLERMAKSAVSFLRQRMVTGVFVIFEGGNLLDHEGVYIRDLDPLFSSPDNSDLLMEVGAANIAKEINASLDRRWAPRFILSKDDSNSDFYYKPFLAVQEYEDIADITAADLGYWSRPFKLFGDDIEVITYSIPIIGSGGEPYGVLGVELTLDYLRTMMPYDEIADNKKGSYLLAIDTQEDLIFENIVSSGPMFKSMMGSEMTTIFDVESFHKNIYKLEKNKRGYENIYGSVQYLNLYNKNTPFEDDRWALIGVVDGKSLLQLPRQLQKYFFLSIIVALSVGIIGIYIVGMWFIEPIGNLVQQVRECDPEHPITFKKTNIAEIDELGHAVEYLRNNVADSASKLSQIISMVNVPIGAFEYTLGDKKVFCSETLFDILEIPREQQNSKYISIDSFNNIMDIIRKHPEDDLENIYRYEKSDGKTYWIRLKTQERKGKILGVVEDVTKDTIDKRKIEYDRDHDLLTRIYNRRAFHSVVKKKIEEEKIPLAAFIMWDLDNLKYINDTYGHAYGDQYIKTTASVLSKFKAYNSIVGRMAGDEFYTFIYGYEHKDDIRKIINQMQEKLQNTVIHMPDGSCTSIQLSAGLAWYPDDSTNYRELLNYADMAMYDVKKSGKGDMGEFNKKL